MKCLLLSTFEQSGGAARSAHLLYRQLNRIGVECRMLVQYKESDDPLVSGPQSCIAKEAAGLRPYLDGLPLLCYRSRLSPPWSLAWLPNNIDRKVAVFAPDIIHLHGTGHGFLPIEAVGRLPGPLAWTLHDSWAFTGGCHLPGDCTRYTDACGRCPQLNRRHDYDLSRWVWRRKASCWPGLDVSFAAPSRWLADCARDSSLLRSAPVEVIPNGIDTDLFSPGDRIDARMALGLAQEGAVLLYGASSFTRDSNKGFAFLRPAVTAVAEQMPDAKLTLAVFGDRHFQNTTWDGIPVRSFGPVFADHQLVSLYRAADLFILPSMQESLSFTVMEAMACGTPCVAFDVGGVGELIVHGNNGCFVPAGDTGGLADGIIWMLSDADRCSGFGRRARLAIESRFSITTFAERYLRLYERAIGRQFHN